VDLLPGLAYARCARRDLPRQKGGPVYVAEQEVLKLVSRGYQIGDLWGMLQNRGSQSSQEAERTWIISTRGG